METKLEKPLDRGMKFRKTSYGMVRNMLINAFKYRFTKDRFFLPLLTSFYATMRCNLRCHYCDYPYMNVPELSTEDTFRLLEKIRPGNPALDITGGEPLLRKDIVDIIRKARELNFSPLILNTAASFLDDKEEVLKYVDYAIISLDSLNTDDWDKVLRIQGAAKRILANIEKYARLRDTYNFRIAINTVISKKTLGSVMSVIDFCDRWGLPVGVVPENKIFDGVEKADPDVVTDPRYLKVIRAIQDRKKKGSKIVSSKIFLDQIATLKTHECWPTTVSRIYPDGTVFYPCHPMDQKIGNLLESENLISMLRFHYQKSGLPPCSYKADRCHLSCYMEATNSVTNPFAMFKELMTSAIR
jgi:MoaA/NifB/PqqE/SkfB family radical SAM enzyme